MQRTTKARACWPKGTGLRNVLRWGRASWKIIGGRSVLLRVNWSVGHFRFRKTRSQEGALEPSSREKAQLQKASARVLAGGPSRTLRAGIGRAQPDCEAL